MLEVHRDRKGGAWTNVQRHPRTATISPVAFPDIAVRIDDLFASEEYGGPRGA